MLSASRRGCDVADLDSDIGWADGVIPGGAPYTLDSDIGWQTSIIPGSGTGDSLIGYGISTIPAETITPLAHVWVGDQYQPVRGWAWIDDHYQPLALPARAPSRPIGIYDGTYNSTSNTDPDLTTLARFGALPAIASAYYNGNQLPAPSETTRILRGTHAVLDCSLFYGVNFSSYRTTFADLANETPAGLDWIDERVERFHTLSQLAPGVHVYASLEQEWDIKKQRELDGRNSYLVPVSAGQYAAALDVFHTRMHDGAPGVITNYWSSGSINTTSDRLNILAVLAAMQVAPKILTIDPYRGKNRPSSETFLQSAGPRITWYRANPDVIRLGTPRMGIAEVGTDVSHGDASVSAFIDSIPAGLDAIDVDFAIWFNRDSGPNNNCQIHDRGLPLSVAALGRQFVASRPA